MFNYKCPNGVPPENCCHVPQLILNVARNFQQKQQLRKESADIQAQASLEQTNHSVEGAQGKQRQKRRG